jgi:hypothetical protein
VRPDQAKGSNADPGWWRQPAGTAARSWEQGDAPLPEPAQASSTHHAPAATSPLELQVRKPGGSGNHHEGH